MAVAWFIAPYVAGPIIRGRPTRRCGMDAYTDQIAAAGGSWSEVEVRGDRAIVRVEAPGAGLDQLAARPELRRLPTNRLDDPLSTLARAARQALAAELEDMGYPLAEIRERFPSADLADVTLRDVLRFMARRRQRARYDDQSGGIVLDGEEVPADPAALVKVLA